MDHYENSIVHIRMAAGEIANRERMHRAYRSPTAEDMDELLKHDPDDMPLFCSKCSVQILNLRLGKCDIVLGVTELLCCDLCGMSDGVCHRQECSQKCRNVDV